MGLVQLFALVKTLERDHEDVMRGIPVEYGALSRHYKPVAESLGWSGKNRKKRETRNDGRPPDTTKELTADSRKKLGRPKGASNVDRNPFTTYQGYVAAPAHAIGRQN